MTHQNIPRQKYITTMSTITHTSSLPCGFAKWTSNNNAFVQFNVSIEIHQGWCPMCWNKNNNLAPLLRIMPLGFKHVLCGKILSINKRVFYTATSFVVIVMGDKLNIVVTWTCPTKHMWSNIIIIYTTQKSSNKRYFDHFNNIIVKQLF